MMNLQVQRPALQDGEVKKRSFRALVRKFSPRSEQILVSTPQVDELAVQLHVANNAGGYHTNQQLLVGNTPTLPSPSKKKHVPKIGPAKYGLHRLGQTTQPQDSNKPECPVDIIAVHGMNGDAFNTWTSETPENGEVNWLDEFLPEEFPGARIYTFGYPAEIFWSSGKATITDHARQLLNDIVLQREGTDAHRPIIFICHSMGGIVVKKALTICVIDADEYSEIHNSVKAIFFLATPHSGSAIAGTATKLAKVANLLGVEWVKTDVLKSLRKGSPILQEISTDWRKQNPRYIIFSFLEMRLTGLLRDLIVNQSDGSLNVATETPVPMAGYDHKSIARFSSREESGYKLVVGALRRTIRDITKS